MALRILDHGLENLARVKARAFFALSQGQPPAAQDQIPILVYNPHPFPVRGVVECEFQLPDYNSADTFTDVTAYEGGEALPTQVEKEASNLNLDWRKRIAFMAELAPSQMNRFDCQLTRLTRRPPVQLSAETATIQFTTEQLEVAINTQTGLMDAYRNRSGRNAPWVDYLDTNAFCPLVLWDNSDPWGMRVRRFREVLGAFHLLSPEAGQRFSGVLNPALASVRVIEDGPVRSVVEAVLGYNDSRLVLRYKLPKQGTEIEVEVRVHWNEKDRLLKLSLPTPDKASIYMGQVAYGSDRLPDNGDESVAQKWVAVISRARDTALTIINDGVYGSDFCYGEARLSLLRSPAYAGHPIDNRPILPQDRYSPRHDQGERLYHFWINGGPLEARLAAVDREALAHNERPMAVSFFPAGGARRPEAFFTLADEVVQLTALKRAEDSDDLIVRLYNPTGQERTTTASFQTTARRLTFGPFEIRTFRLHRPQDEWVEVDLVEEVRLPPSSA
jgi:alpha-mannosidase